jgi:hypothetical protein
MSNKVEMISDYFFARLEINEKQIVRIHSMVDGTWACIDMRPRLSTTFYASKEVAQKWFVNECSLITLREILLARCAPPVEEVEEVAEFAGAEMWF